jgi:hypothetical protein
MTLFPTDFIERFWSKVERLGPNDCWEWNGDKSTPGYGRIYERLGYKKWKAWGAHRVSFILSRGHAPKFGVCHTCDNRPCVNPNHLFDGDQTVNMQDCKAKGRTRNKPFGRGDDHIFRKNPAMIRRGAGHPNSRLTDVVIKDIYAKRMSGKTAKEIAIAMDLKFQTVLGVIEGLAWQHMLGVDGNPTAAELRSAGPGKARKLTQDQADKIRIRLADGTPRKEICLQFSISPAMLSLIHQGKAWPS